MKDEKLAITKDKRKLQCIICDGTEDLETRQTKDLKPVTACKDCFDDCDHPDREFVRWDDNPLAERYAISVCQFCCIEFSDESLNYIEATVAEYQIQMDQYALEKAGGLDRVQEEQRRRFEA